MITSLITDESIQILNNNYIGDLAYVYNNRPYIVPTTYFYDSKQHTIICYSGKGHKINALQKNNAIALCISNIENVNHWESILIHGTYTERTGSDAKALLHRFSLGVKELIKKKENRSVDFITQFCSKIYTKYLPVIFTIKIEGITGKKRESYMLESSC